MLDTIHYPRAHFQIASCGSENVAEIFNNVDDLDTISFKFIINLYFLHYKSIRVAHVWENVNC